MKNKSVTVAIIIVIILAGLAFWGYQNGGNSVSAVQGVSETEMPSALAAGEKNYDFGQISMRQGNVQKEFTINNPTDQTITITTAVTSCMCTNAYLVSSDGSVKGPFGMVGMGYVPPADLAIKSGESVVLRAVFDPNAHGPAGVGAIDRFIRLTDGAGGTLQFEIKGTVTP